MRRLPVFAVVAALSAVLSSSLAAATPPSGRFTFRDLVRAKIADPGTLSMPAGTDVLSSSYTMSPGASSGWRTLPGPTVLALSKGKLTIRTAGCATKEYVAGQAAILPAGPYEVSNN